MFSKLILLFPLALLTLSGCDHMPQTEQQSPAMGARLASNNTDEGEPFTQVLASTPLQFPQDHQAHNGFRIEWWYLTANLTTQTGEKIGIQWTQFKNGLSSKEVNSNSNWASNQLYFAHSAITSESSHQVAEKYSRAHPEFAGVSASPFAIYLDNWRWQGHQNDEPFPATLTMQNSDFGYELTLSSDAPWQLQGDKGFSIKSADGTVASHYYSQPYIEVNGRITRNGITEQVSGMAWLDREWSSNLLKQEQQGWDWFSLRLSDEQTLMVFRLRDQQQNHFYSARLMNKDGTGKSFHSPDKSLTLSQQNLITMSPTLWHQMGKKRYPVNWKIDIPSEAISVTTKAINPASEMQLSIPYWEGPILFSGTHQGNGYMELTGY